MAISIARVNICSVVKKYKHVRHSIKLTTMCSVVDNPGSASIESKIIRSPHATLPANFRAWKKLGFSQEGYGWQWELLRTFFSSKSYTLYVFRLSDPSRGLQPKIENDPPDDSFGLLGVRNKFWPLPFFECNVRLIPLHIHFES